MRLGFNRTCAPGWWLIVTLVLSSESAFAQRATGVNRTTGAARATTGGAARSGEYPKSTEVGEAMITSNPETRQIIIVTDEDTNLQIGNVVTNLDRPKPQALIKVVFLQVTLRDELDLGVEGSFTHKSINGGDGTVGTSFSLDSLAATVAGGGFYRIVGDDITLLIRALAVAGKTEILSRPSILARNSQLATIVVGQEVPFVTNSRQDNNGNLINTVQYQDIGIILRVTPFISSDGMVEMILAPEISALSDQTVEIGSGLVAPVIDKRSADTVVVTPNGKTVAIGGLIGTQKTSQVRKVPILGDIPLLGLAFKRTIKSDIRTELVILLTPYVIMQPGDLVKMTEEERNKLELAPQTFEEKELNRLLDGLPKKQPETPATGTVPAPKKK